MQSLPFQPATMWRAILGLRCSIAGNGANWLASRPGWCRGAAAKMVRLLEGSKNHASTDTNFSRLILSLRGLWSLNDKINLEKSKGLPKERTQKRSRKKQAQKEKDKATKPTTPKQRKNEEKKQEQKRRKGGKDKNRKRRKFPNLSLIHI